jgi:hypothetical protein
MRFILATLILTLSPLLHAAEWKNPIENLVKLESELSIAKSYFSLN